MATKKPALKKKAPTKKKAPAKKASSESSPSQPSNSSSSKPQPRFTPEARAFIGELAKRQSREWFAPRKAEFKALLEEPLRALLLSMGPLLMETFPAVEDATPKIFRIHRDTRFSKDKATPSSSSTRGATRAVGGELSLGRAGFYFHFAADEVFAAVGLWQMEPEILKRYRRTLVDNLVNGDAVGDALLKETLALEKAGFKLMSFEELARAPTGVSPTHPRIHLLKHKGWAVALPMAHVDAAAAGLPALLASSVLQTKKALSLLEKAIA